MVLKPRDGWERTSGTPRGKTAVSREGKGWATEYLASLRNKNNKTTMWLSNIQVPMAVWSPFYMSLTDSLVNKDGILNFFHDHLRQAVERKYLSTAEDKRATYHKLADYFATKELTDRAVSQPHWRGLLYGDKGLSDQTVSGVCYPFLHQ